MPFTLHRYSPQCLIEESQLIRLVLNESIDFLFLSGRLKEDLDMKLLSEILFIKGSSGSARK